MKPLLFAHMTLALFFFLYPGCTRPTLNEGTCPADGELGACCDVDFPCGGELFCHGTDALLFCTQSCTPSDSNCPEGNACTFFEGEAVCIPEAGRVGDICVPEGENECNPGLFCFGDQGVGNCTALCDSENLCPPKEVVGDRVCVEFTDDLGAFCMRPCEGDTDCALGLVCTEVPDTGWSVCFPPPVE